MRDINFEKQDLFEDSSVTINQNSIVIEENYTELIQKSLREFIDYIETSIMNFKGGLLDYACETKKINNVNINLFLELANEFFIVEKIFKADGMEEINKIVFGVESKEFSERSFQRWTKIIKNHKEIACEIFEKEMDFDRIEFITKYINELAVYLNMDLKLSALEDIRSRVIKPQNIIDNTIIIKGEDIDFEEYYVYRGSA